MPPRADPRKILFLGYDRQKTQLIAEIERHGCRVEHTDEKIGPRDGAAFDLILSFGYRHIIPAAVIDTCPPIVNLHISYLPWNRGAHPNYWAFADGTPHGVSIHRIDKGVDTGPVLFQRYVNFAADEDTFAKTHRRLVDEVESLFREHADEILAGSFSAKPQRGKGSCHRMADLPAAFPGWETKIAEYLQSIDTSQSQHLADKLRIIDQIEKVRTANNVNWMDLLRLAFRSSPEEAKVLIRRINTDDNKISHLFSQLGE